MLIDYTHGSVYLSSGFYREEENAGVYSFVFIKYFITSTRIVP